MQRPTTHFALADIGDREMSIHDQDRLVKRYARAVIVAAWLENRTETGQTVTGSDLENLISSVQEGWDLPVA